MINNESRSDRFGTTSTLPATPDIIEEWVKGKAHRALLLELPEEVHIDYTRLLMEHFDKALTTIYQRGSKEGAMKQNEMFVRHIDEIMKVTTNPHELVDWLVFYRNTINPNNYEHTSTTKQ